MDLREQPPGDIGDHWYYQHKYQEIKSSLDRNRADLSLVKDIGSGSGYFLERLLKDVPGSNGIAIDPNYSKEDLEAFTLGRRFTADPSQYRATTYLLMDVLEHVDDDLALLRSYVSTASNGATVLITVPMHEELWSPHDDYLGHFRRYSVQQLETLVSDAGLTIEESRSIFRIVYPAVRMVRALTRKFRQNDRKSDLAPQSSFINHLLGLILRIDQLLPPRSKGVSHIVVAKKK